MMNDAMKYINKIKDGVIGGNNDDNGNNGNNGNDGNNRCLPLIFFFYLLINGTRLDVALK